MSFPLEVYLSGDKMKNLICRIFGHKLELAKITNIYVGWCKRCDQSVFEKRRAREMKNPGKNEGRRANDGQMGTLLKDRAGEVVLGVICLVAMLGAAVADGIKNDIEYRNKERQEVVIIDQDHEDDSE